MKIYIDSEFQCHTTNPDGVFREVESAFFDNKCQAFVEGYRFVPSGESWTRSDGVVFHGEMIAPMKDYTLLSSIQLLFEEMSATAIKEDRIAALEEENAALKEVNAKQAAQVSALSDQMDFYEECIVEMAAVVYA